MSERKIRSNKGKKRGPYRPRLGPSKPRLTSDVKTKCVSAFINKTLKLTKTGTPYLNTKAGNRYSCKTQLEKKSMYMFNYKKPAGQKPNVRPSQFKKGTIRNGFIVQMVKVPASTGYRKAWRKI